MCDVETAYRGMETIAENTFLVDTPIGKFVASGVRTSGRTPEVSPVWEGLSPPLGVFTSLDVGASIFISAALLV